MTDFVPTARVELTVNSRAHSLEIGAGSVAEKLVAAE